MPGNHRVCSAQGCLCECLHPRFIRQSLRCSTLDCPVRKKRMCWQPALPHPAVGVLIQVPPRPRPRPHPQPVAASQAGTGGVGRFSAASSPQPANQPPAPPRWRTAPLSFSSFKLPSGGLVPASCWIQAGTCADPCVMLRLRRGCRQQQWQAFIRAASPPCELQVARCSIHPKKLRGVCLQSCRLCTCASPEQTGLGCQTQKPRTSLTFKSSVFWAQRAALNAGSCTIDVSMSCFSKSAAAGLGCWGQEVAGKGSHGCATAFLVYILGAGGRASEPRGGAGCSGKSCNSVLVLRRLHGS